MTHISENVKPLKVEEVNITDLSQLRNMPSINQAGHVYLLRFPPGRDDHDAENSQTGFQHIATFCNALDESSVICILTTPPDAARIYPYLSSANLRFQLWIAVKSYQPAPQETTQLSQEHSALLIFSRYSKPLVHTITRIAYTYCPACGKTTKDYGGKKHLHHVDGTIISDVWRDIQINLSNDIEPVIGRLRDLFGLEPYHTLTILDFSEYEGFAHINQQQFIETNNIPLIPEIHLDSRLVNGNCLGELKNIPDDSIDFCFADLPYNIDKKYDGYDDALETQEYFSWCNQWLSELARIIKPGHTCAILNIPFGVIHHYQYLATILDFQSWIVWDSLAFPTKRIMPAHYAILCFSKGIPRSLPGLKSEPNQRDSNLIPQAELFCIRPDCVAKRKAKGIQDRGQLTDLWHDVHRLKHNSRRVDHPCQLPPTMMHRLFGIFTNTGEIVLDCFNGAGTSTLVAAQMGRRYIGIEISTEYYNLALQRHSELEQGIDPFRKRTDIPTAKNSRVRRISDKKRKVSKKILQLDVKRIAEILGRLPTHDEVAQMSDYPIEYYDEYFVSWGEVCAAARTTGMTEFPENKDKDTKDFASQPPLFSES